MSGAVDTWLRTLFEAEPDPGVFVEVRQLGGGRPPLREFIPIFDLDRVAERVLELGRERDTYVGVAPRCRREGGKAAIRRLHVLWADCDTEGSVDRLSRFEPSPTLAAWSGSGGCHAYWRLRDPAPPELAEAANRRLAHAFGADVASTDASRILRPPQTRNFKHAPPVEVILDRWRGGTHPLSEIAGHLPDPPETHAPPRRARGPRPADHGDVLLTIEPAVYFRALAGIEVGRDGKVRCPLPGHGDTDPSCHVYDGADAGWYCYGCGRGGSIYDLARELSGHGDRGAGFTELRAWVAQRLLHAPLRTVA